MTTLIRTDRPDRINRIFKGAVDDVSAKKRTITSIISTDCVDCYNEIIVSKGVDTKAFLENPVVLWCHNATIVIARCVGLKRTTKNDRNVWIAKTLFAETEKAEEVFQLYAQGFLNGWSIGGYPDWSACSAPTAEEIKANPHYKLARCLIRKLRLVEYSACSIPANPESLGNELEKAASAELVRMIRESGTWAEVLGESESGSGLAPPSPASTPGRAPGALHLQADLPPLPPPLPPLVGRTFEQALAETRATVARMTGGEAARKAAEEAIDRLKGRV